MTAQLVLPGETLPISSTSAMTLGPGISVSTPSASTSGSGSTTTFISTKLGVLKSTSSKGKEKGTAYWVESNSKRASPLCRCFCRLEYLLDNEASIG